MGFVEAEGRANAKSKVMIRGENAGIKMLERQSVEHDKGGRIFNSERMNSTKLNTQH